MTRQEFCVELQEMLQCEETLHEETILSDLEEWDSLSIMILITFFDKKFGQRITFDEVKACSGVTDLIAAAKGSIS